MGIIHFDYEGSSIQFEEVNGQIMANATLMAKVFLKDPDDIFKTKSWKDYEKVLIDIKNIRSEDVRYVKQGGIYQGSWIHQELVIEFARRLNPKFSIWCNDRIAELLRTGKVELKPLSPAEALLQNVQLLVEQERRINKVEERLNLVEAKQTTSPQNYFAVSGYASYYKIYVDTNTAKKAGVQASKLCKELGYVMGSVPDAKYGSVKTYPVDVLETVFKGMNLSR